MLTPAEINSIQFRARLDQLQAANRDEKIYLQDWKINIRKQRLFIVLSFGLIMGSAASLLTWGTLLIYWLVLVAIEGNLVMMPLPLVFIATILATGLTMKASDRALKKSTNLRTQWAARPRPTNWKTLP